MAKKTVPKTVKEFIEAIDQEGLDYAILNYVNTDDVRDVDPVLAYALDTYRDARETVLARLKDHGFSED